MHTYTHTHKCTNTLPNVVTSASLLLLSFFIVHGNTKDNFAFYSALSSVRHKHIT